MPLQPGARFGPYEILAPVGAGGMGEVYRARDTRLGREVAIKVLQLSASDAELQLRIQREAQIIASLSHPHICALYDIGSEGTVPFLVMEYIEGESLAGRLSRGAMPLEQALTYGVQIASAIEAAHRRGVVHRDLKPSNVMLTRSGAKLLDFGLAKPALPQLYRKLSADSAADTTPLGPEFRTTAGGTLPYMAPEQIEGREADARADIFSFGALLYEMVTGNRAFPGDSPGRIVASILTEEPPRMSRFQSAVPPALEELVSTCIAKDREERWQSAHDLTRTLRWLSEGSGAVSREEAAMLLRSAQRVPARRQWALTAGIVALVAVGGVASWRARPLTAGPRNVVILPCRSLGDAGDRSMCDGIAETLTARLVQLSSTHDLQVVPASQVRGERITSVEQARSVLGATLALEGSLLRAGETLRLNYVIVDPRTHEQVDAVSVTAPAADPFALQDQVVEWATRALELQLTEGERRALRSRGTQTANAFAEYQQGRGRISTYQTAEDVDAAISSFTRAIELDGRFAQAHAALGLAQWIRYEVSRDSAWVERARSACSKALTLDPRLADAHLCAGTVALGTGRYRDAIGAFQSAIERAPELDQAYLGLGRAHEMSGNLDAAERLFQNAVRRRPRYWMAHQWLGNFYREQSRFEQAVSEYEEAARLNPGNARVQALLGAMYVYAGRYKEALQTFRISNAITPTYGVLNNWGMTLYRLRVFGEAANFLTQACTMRTSHQCLGNLARTYYWTGRRPESGVLLQRATELASAELVVNPHDLETRIALAEYYAKLGKRDAAMHELATANPGNDAHLMLYVAMAHAQLNNRPAALDWLQKAVANRLPLSELRAWPELDSLKDEPRFRSLAAARPGA